MQASPPATTIMPLPQNRAAGAESLFTFEVTGATGVPVRDVYYQLDTWTGPWQRAVPTGVPGAGKARSLTRSLARPSCTPLL